MSADPENEYFSDGITEEIISKLSRIQNLGVASRTSVSRFKNTQKDIKDIGRELSVRYVLEGSVRKAGSRVRIAVQLTDASTGFQLWSDDFEGDLKDVFGLQERTALKIAEALNLRLTPKEQQAVQRRSTQNPEAYDAYLRGRAMVEFFDEPKKLDKARGHFEKALKYDQDYALALAGLSIVEAQYYRNLDPSEARAQRAEELAKRALSLDPQLAEARMAMGRNYSNRFDYVRGAAEFQEATRLEPDNPYAWDLLCWALAYQQPPDGVGAEKAGKEAVRLSSASFGAYYHLGRAFLVQKKYKEAAEAFQQAKALNPAFSTADFGLAQVFVAEGNYEQARKLLEQLVEVRKSPGISYQLSATYAGLQEKEKALRTLENALQNGYRDFAAIDSQPQFDTLRSDPRFQQLLKRYRK